MLLFLDDDEKVARRRARKEFNLVWQLCNQIPFESVKEQKKAKLFSFGSNRDREILPPRNCYFDPKFSLYKDPGRKRAKISGGEKPHSTFSTATRFPETVSQVPAPNFYRLPEVSRSLWKFSKDLPRSSDHVGHGDVPGPGTYKIEENIEKELERSKSKKSCYTLCKVFCDDDHCNDCEEELRGDFYHLLAQAISLCQRCYALQSKVEERNPKVVQRFKKTARLNSFQKVRFCDFYHQHMATERATTNPVSLRELKKKLNLENYLFRYQIR